MYTYNAVITRIIDGDSIEATLDLGLYTFKKVKIRLLGIDCPEMNTVAGHAAKAWLIRYLAENAIKNDGYECQIETRKADSFGRWLGWIRVNGVLINDEIIQAGHATKYLKSVRR